MYWWHFPSTHFPGGVYPLSVSQSESSLQGPPIVISCGVFSAGFGPWQVSISPVFLSSHPLTDVIVMSAGPLHMFPLVPEQCLENVSSIMSLKYVCQGFPCGILVSPMISAPVISGS